ncbi:MAG: D-alanyl-D-alanine carboxypeptidase [Patescibacteria group bacterium]|nr:D-alanyl-D-alanine carboxypeptidase [Patescibacteria group bacterium]
MNSNLKIFTNIGGVILAALVVGFLSAQAKFFLSRYHPSPIAKASTTDVEVDEEDPSFISGISRVYNYTSSIDVETSDDAAIIPAITGPITAQEYLVLDLHSGAILQNKDIDRVVPIASLSKLVTAEVSRQLMASTTIVKITDSILAAYGSNGHLREGEEITTGDLLYPLFLVSSNDAAEALAQGYPGGRKNFIRAMNDWVHSIGAYRTDFYDPSGLSPLSVSTARDQATILEWLLKNDPALMAITSMRSASVGLHTWTNSTHFMNLADYVGGKDGYIPEAGETADSLFSTSIINEAANVAQAAVKNLQTPARYLVIVLGSKNRDNDVLSLLKKAEGK